MFYKKNLYSYLLFMKRLHPYISGYGWYTQGVGVAVFDFNYDPTKTYNPGHEFIFVWMDNPYGENKMYYLIEWESRVWSHP